MTDKDLSVMTNAELIAEVKRLRTLVWVLRKQAQWQRQISYIPKLTADAVGRERPDVRRVS